MVTPLPGPVKTGAGRVFTFSHAEDLDGCYGLCHFDTHTIEIERGHLPIEETDTVLHELFHAILFSQGREFGGKTEEAYVRALATGLTGVLQENPEFLKWLNSRFPHTP